jgi:threonine synthase
LCDSGLADKVPRLIGVQAQACDPFARAIASGAERCAPVQAANTLAEGIVLSTPVRDREVLKALRDSGGTVLSVSEGAIRDGFYRLAGLGFYVEPTSAVVGAALEKLIEDGEITIDRSVVAILTGSGLKFGRLP